MNQLHSGARWLFRLKAYWILILIGLIFSIWFFKFIIGLKLIESVGSILIVVLIFYILFILIFGEIFARMSYNRWFYEFTKEGLKLERGIIWKRYSNVPYERIQNVDVHRGIIARIVGFSTIEIQTAGYSAYYRGRSMHSEGHIPAIGINEAEEIRNFVLKHISHKRNGF